MLFDSVYTGPDSDTPRLRRLFIPKNPRTMTELADYEVCAKLRVPVEQFFGRLTKLWDILSGVFCFDHDHFDLDFNICVLLTNEHIRNHDSKKVDYRFYRALLERKEEILKCEKIRESVRRGISLPENANDWTTWWCETTEEKTSN